MFKIVLKNSVNFSSVLFFYLGTVSLCITFSFSTMSTEWKALTLLYIVYTECAVQYNVLYAVKISQFTVYLIHTVCTVLVYVSQTVLFTLARHILFSRPVKLLLSWYRRYSVATTVCHRRKTIFIFCIYKIQTVKRQTAEATMVGNCKPRNNKVFLKAIQLETTNVRNSKRQKQQRRDEQLSFYRGLPLVRFFRHLSLRGSAFRQLSVNLFIFWWLNQPL